MPVKINNIEDLIIKAVAPKPQETTQLIAEVNKIRLNTTKQAVYACLRKLAKENLILVNKQIVSLNLKYVDKMIKFYSDIKHDYTQTNYEGNFIYLNNGERIVYYFKNSLQTDIFWTHAISILVESLIEKTIIYNFNPHNYFILYNQENESQVIDKIVNSGHMFLISADNADYLDKHVKQLYKNEKIQYHILDKKFFPSNNHYFNIIGDYIIETYFDKKTADAIDQFYREANSFDSKKIAELKNIISKRGRDKIVISKNKARATILKKRLQKYFYIPKEYKTS